MVLLAGCPQECAPAQPSPAAPAGAAAALPAGLSFAEDFADPASFGARFDHGVSGNVAGNDWHGDHDTMCGNPNTTSRTIHVARPSEQETPFYQCAPGGDVSKAHLMTSINTEGYTIAWFSPRQSFSNLHRVCWDQNLTDLGGGKWTQVLFLTQAEAARSGGDLGFTSPEFPNDGGPSTPRGSAAHGVKIFGGTAASWSSIGEWNAFKPGTVQLMYNGGQGDDTTDKAARFQQCLTDNENGTLTLTRQQPNGGVLTGSVAGDIPNEPVRVVFEDDNYNPDKHQDPSVATNTSFGYTWHWDNIQIG
jgi:hypothetical protein